MTRFAPLLVLLALGAAITWILVATPDPDFALTAITGAMLVGALILLILAILADMRRVAASWKPVIGAVLIAMLAVASTSAIAADLTLGAAAALVAAVAVVVITWRTWRLSGST